MSATVAAIAIPAMAPRESPGTVFTCTDGEADVTLEEVEREGICVSVHSESLCQRTRSQMRRGGSDIKGIEMIGAHKGTRGIQSIKHKARVIYDFLERA